MGIRLQRGTHTTQRKKATKVEKVKVKSQFNCNCSQTQAEQANQREKVNFAAGLLENTTKMKMKMKYSPISMVQSLCGVLALSLSLPLKREWVHYAWVKLLLLKPLFIVTLDFIWRFATTVLVVGGWWFSSLFIFFLLQTEPSYFWLFWAFPVLHHHHHHHRSSIFLSTAVNRNLRQIINKGTPIFCCCFLQRVEVVRQILVLVIQQQQQQQQLTAVFSVEKQCKWENTTVQTHNTFSCYFCCTFVQQQQQLAGLSTSQLLLERQIVLQLAQLGASTAKHSQFSSERWIEFGERIKLNRETCSYSTTQQGCSSLA